MNYKQTIEFLYSSLPTYHRIGKAAYKNDLANTIALDDHFSHPHTKYKTIHIAGTNGKGSVSHITASVLQAAGWKTGLYTSPHLKDFRERIRVNGKMISREEVIQFVKSNRDIIEKIKPSFFELTVAMAFDFFYRQEVDVAVIETGLGGRLDSTNIILPVLSVITNIGHDHMDLLGNSLEKVAGEKAGIIKKHIPVIIGETQKESKEVFIRKAREMEAPVYFADTRFRCSLEEWNPGSSYRKFSVKDLTDNSLFNGTIPLPGNYQLKNIQTLFQVFNLLDSGFGLSDKTVKTGIRNVIRNTGLMGRWQVIGKDPLTICDTGHNKEGIEYVTRQIEMTPSTGLHMVIGFVSDKDLSEILPLLPKKAKYYFTRAEVERALDENLLKMIAGEYGLEGKSYATVKEALAAARTAAATSDLVFVGGSNFIVAGVV